jgi:hypothetical protein
MIINKSINGGLYLRLTKKDDSDLINSILEANKESDIDLYEVVNSLFSKDIYPIFDKDSGASYLVDMNKQLVYEVSNNYGYYNELEFGKKLVQGLKLYPSNEEWVFNSIVGELE